MEIKRGMMIRGSKRERKRGSKEESERGRERKMYRDPV